jgi:(4S)-4-hydroxy-5-phosphonooxypentane-2,3-dione isomerase
MQVFYEFSQYMCREISVNLPKICAAGHSPCCEFQFFNLNLHEETQTSISAPPITFVMIATLVHVWVKQSHVNAFISATEENHAQSVKEPGNLRFDVLQDDGDPCKFVLYEAYASEEAAVAHKSTAHYLRWRDAVADWMAQPRQGVKHSILCPSAPW